MLFIRYYKKNSLAAFDVAVVLFIFFAIVDKFAVNPVLFL